MMEKPDLTPDLLTATIKSVTADWLASGKITEVRYIGDGLCYDFAEEVHTRLGRHEDRLYGRGDLETAETEDYWVDDFCFDLHALRRAGEIVPDDIPANEFATKIGSATHEWMRFQGKHYDATAPEGVDRFLDLPFFSDQVEGLRREFA